MTAPESDVALLLDLLNSTPVVGDTQQDELTDARIARAWLQAHDLPMSQWRPLVVARDTLQAVVRGEASADTLAPLLDGVSYRPVMSGTGVEWTLDVPRERAAATRAVLTWDALRVGNPGRLRPCANTECRRFLFDRSKPNTARWCSMATCGNRLKARRHYQRVK
jgi:hypothetical protein